MNNTVIKMNYLDLVRDSMCEYIMGNFYKQLTYEVITAFYINDKVIIHTCNGHTIIENGLEPSENIINRMKEIGGSDILKDNALSLHIGDWEIMALDDENAVYITQK